MRELATRNLRRFEPRLLDARGLHRAAVGVVLLADQHQRASFILTRRPSTLRRHAGQWALPGGRLEADETPQAAALREICEEVGIHLTPDAVLGRLDDFPTRSGHLVSPFVVWSSEESELKVDPAEVDAAFIVPLSELLHPEALRLEPLLHFSMPSLATTVHAPTAAMLYQFREVAVYGREVRVADTEQPLFAWR